MATPTPQQTAAIEKKGRIIVSASAGSGKTFVMIERLVAYVTGGGDIEDVLAVTFTKKAAAQMKDKLRSALIKSVASAGENERARLKQQLSKISLANISTIHSFCAYLLRVYFYLLDIDGSFEIISEDGGAEAQMRGRALDSLFARLYEEENDDFIYLLARYGRKRGDNSLRAVILSAYDAVRNTPDYGQFLNCPVRADEEVFNSICRRIYDDGRTKCGELIAEIESFCAENNLNDACKKIAGEMTAILRSAMEQRDIFQPLPKFSTSRKPPKSGEDEVSRAFFELRDYVKGRYDKLYDGLGIGEEELASYLSTDRTARAFAWLLSEFDGEYSRLKREEGKLDYGDLEHLTLKLLSLDGMVKEVRSRFKQVFVDEYQDVNPVQERIISLVSGENLFLVGDVKQAIYGFRGSRSEYFTKKEREFASHGGGLVLSHNFRSAPGVIDAVNANFSRLMRADTCGIDYKSDSVMLAGGAYPPSCGGAYVHIFGREEKSKSVADGVYSVEREELKKQPLPREGLAVLDIVRRELSSTFYDIETGSVRAVEPGDICILTRKRDNSSSAGIMRALTAAGFTVSGGQGGNACDYPEVKQLTDILSFIDNGEQDIPLASALLSPVGGLSEDELAAVKIRYREQKELTFRACCEKYGREAGDKIASKLKNFEKKIEEYRTLSRLFGAGTVIDNILKDTALEAKYYQDGGKKLKNLRRLSEAAYTPSGELSLGEFLTKLKAGGYNLPVAESGGGDSITMMTMHSSKGLEFPVVILADVCKPYRGQGERALPFDEEYGFAHRAFDVERRVSAPTVLGKYIKLKTAREEVRGEMNLLYVACTRAKYRLHIMSAESGQFNKFRVSNAANYAQMLDFSCFKRENSEDAEFFFEEPSPALISKPDSKAEEAIAARFMRPYAYEASVGLPVKSSASALLKADPQDEYYAEHVLFPEEDDGADAAARGTAYHRFLQLCDFSVKDEDGIAHELNGFVACGDMTGEEAALLSCASLAKILCMPCFERVHGANTFREREFLCALPANSFMDTSSADDVLVQGAIDLLCEREGVYTIIDYKFSTLTEQAIVARYARQLGLYRLAVEKILGVPKGEIEAYIVNIRTLKEIKLN